MRARARALGGGARARARSRVGAFAPRLSPRLSLDLSLLARALSLRRYFKLFNKVGDRPDQFGDRGPEYRNVVGLPGGAKGPLAAALVAASQAQGDRLDSDNRVYAENTVVACCGDCNMLKYKYGEDAFIAQCVAVATFNVGVDAFPGDVDEEADDDEDEAAALEGEGAAEGRLEDAEETIAAAASEGDDDTAASDPLFAQFAFAGGE